MSSKTVAKADETEVQAIPVNHRADAARAFLDAWLPRHGVSADAFGEDDALALLDALDTGVAASA